VYWITGKETPWISEVIATDAIHWVELYPDPREEIENRNIFISNRKFFSSAYLQLLAKVKGVSRQELLPSSSYRSHMEGPLMGLLRKVENMADSFDKDWLRKQLKALEKVVWYKTKAEGRKYYIDKDASLYEKALSLLLATWSFWAYRTKIQEPQQFMLIIEPPKELLMTNIDPEVQGIVAEALRILNYLTEVTTTSIILSTETLQPALDHHYRYKLLFQTRDSDIAWEKEMDETGMWEDSFSGERSIAVFRHTNIEFCDDFKGL
jgi:hypothetical protein